MTVVPQTGDITVISVWARALQCWHNRIICSTEGELKGLSPSEQLAIVLPHPHPHGSSFVQVRVLSSQSPRTASLVFIKRVANLASVGSLNESVLTQLLSSWVGGGGSAP
jgi:hypothetical protein